MVDEVQVVSGCDGHGPAPTLDEASVGLMQGLVHVHKGIDDSLSVGGGHRQLRIDRGEIARAEVLQARGQRERGGLYTEGRKEEKLWWSSFIYIP